MRFARRPTFVLGIGLALVLTTGAYAFTALNSVPNTMAGEGQSAVTGFTVSNVIYTMSTADPSLVGSVSFNLNAGATAVNATLENDNTGTFLWYTCSTNSAAWPWTSWTCVPKTTAIQLADLYNLEVYAVGTDNGYPNPQAP